MSGQCPSCRVYGFVKPSSFVCTQPSLPAEAPASPKRGRPQLSTAMNRTPCIDWMGRDGDGIGMRVRVCIHVCTYVFMRLCSCWLIDPIRICYAYKLLSPHPPQLLQVEVEEAGREEAEVGHELREVDSSCSLGIRG